MVEVFRSNDLVAISFAQSLLRDAGVEATVLDAHASVVEGSIGAIQRRLMVPDENAEQARALLAGADVLDA